MATTIEIKRKIERHRGNQMLFNKIKQGSYQLHTGEIDAIEERKRIYSDRFKHEIDEFIERVNEDEGLNLSDSEKRLNATHLKSQINEGKERVILRFRDKSTFGI